MNQSIDGHWVGGIEIADDWMFIKAHFTTKKKRKATVSIPQKGIHDVVPDFTFESSRVHIELPDHETLIFDGQLKNGTLSGDFRQREKEGTFWLTRVVADSEVCQEYFGTYQVEPNRLLLFGKRWGSTVYFEERTIVRIYPVSEATFFSERGETITFVQKNGEKGLTWHKRGFNASGTNVALYKEEEVQFCNGDVTLSGTLAIPSGDGLHPAVILIHGSGDEDRESYRFLADHLARHGIAALRYDKRGVKASTGDWHYSTLNDLAEDVLTGVRFLKPHKNIHPGKIGLLGTSQGAWVAPLAASRSKDVAFTILVSGAGVSPKNQELYRVTHELRYLGFSPVQVTLRVVGYRIQLFVAKLFQAIQKVLPVSKILPKAVAFALYLDWDFDVVPYLKTVTCPVLAIYGELDKLVPVQKSAEILEKALKNNFTIKIFPKGNHALLESEVGVWSEIPFLKKKEFVSGYYNLISDWISKQM